MSRKIVHIIGTGTIGVPLISILTERKTELGIEEVTFQPDVNAITNKALIKGLAQRGAKLAIAETQTDQFTSLGFKVEYIADEAIDRAGVIIDCTPEGEALLNKERVYKSYLGTNKCFIAQARETGFGKDYAYGINDEALEHGKDQFLRIVSCNAQNIASIVKALAFPEGENLLEWGRFICLRRASDISEDRTFIPAPQVSIHQDEDFGTYQARDAASLFRTIGHDLDLFSSAVRINTQYLHLVHFNLKLRKPVSLPRVLTRLESYPQIALTNHTMSNLVFAFARDIGFLGRIFNQAVVIVPSLAIKGENEIVGYSFSPQDGNSVFSSIAAAVWFYYPNSYREKLQHLNDLIFAEV